MKTGEDFQKPENDLNKALVDLGSFLTWGMDEGLYSGGVSAERATDALQVLLGWDDEKMSAFLEIFRKDM